MVNKFKNIILLSSLAFIVGCATTNIVNTPNVGSSASPSPSSSINSTVPSSSPTASPIPIVRDYSFPEKKGNFIINTLYDRNYYGVKVNLDEKGNGIIVGKKLIKVNSFVIDNQSYDYAQGTEPTNFSINTDSNGNGLIVWAEEGVGCADFCEPRKYSLRGRKLENYLPVGNNFVVDNDVAPEIQSYIKLDNSGNGKIIYLFNYRYYEKDVMNFAVQSQERKAYIESTADLTPKTDRSINDNGSGAVVNIEDSENKNQQGSTTKSIFLRKIENNQIIDNKLPVADNIFTLSQTPIIDLNKNGDGLVVWIDTINRPFQSAVVYARYVSNYIPQ